MFWNYSGFCHLSALRTSPSDWNSILLHCQSFLVRIHCHLLLQVPHDCPGKLDPSFRVRFYDKIPPTVSLKLKWNMWYVQFDEMVRLEPEQLSSRILSFLLLINLLITGFPLGREITEGEGTQRNKNGRTDYGCHDLSYSIKIWFEKLHNLIYLRISIAPSEFLHWA